MNKTALSVLCLLIGGSVGAFVGFQWGAQGRSDAASASPMGNTGAEGPIIQRTRFVQKQSPPPRGGLPIGRRGGSESLSATLDAMLLNFDPVAVEGWALSAEMPLEEILAGLSFLAAKPKETKHRAELKAVLYRAWAKREPDKAWAAALIDGDGPSAGYFLGAVAKQVATTQPTAAVNLALSLSMGERRGNVLSEVFEEWGRGDLAGAVAYWNSHPELPADYEVIMSAIKAAVGANPAFAASQAMQLRNADARGPVLAQVLIDWAHRDVPAALQWAQRITDPEVMRLQTMIVVDAWAVKDAATALAFAEKIEDPQAKSGAVRNAWHNLLLQSPGTALDYLVQNPAAVLLDEIRMRFARATASLTLQEQQALLLRIPDEETKQKLTGQLVEGQAGKGQYTAALQLINAMPDSGDRDRAITNLGVAWGRGDMNAAAAWLKTQLDSTDRDLLVEGFARSLAAKDPQGAIEWLNTVPDKGVREGGLKNVASKWLAAKPAEAEAWLSSQTWLSESDRGYLLKNASRASGYSSHTYGINITNRR